MSSAVFSTRFKNLRKKKGMSQEQIAELVGVSVQAVSKWECAQSYPDIELLPVLSDIMKVSIDYLLKETVDRAEGEIEDEIDWQDDEVLRIVQFKGRRLLTQNIYDRKVKIPLYIEEDCLDDVKMVAIWGSAEIEGNIGGNVDAGGGVNCDDVGGNVDAGGGVNCGNVGVSVDAGGGVNCGNVGASVDCGGGVNCGNVGRDVSCGRDINCGHVHGSVEAKGNVRCGDIDGDVNVGKNLECKSIKGNVKCEGDIYYK